MISSLIIMDQKKKQKRHGRSEKSMNEVIINVSKYDS